MLVILVWGGWQQISSTEIAPHIFFSFEILLVGVKDWLALPWLVAGKTQPGKFAKQIFFVFEADLYFMRITSHSLCDPFLVWTPTFEKRSMLCIVSFGGNSHSSEFDSISAK